MCIRDRAQSVRDVVISTGYGSEFVVNHFSAQPVTEMNVQCVAELQPMGTGGGLAYAAAQCGASPESWLVVNGDSLIFADVNVLVNELGDADGVMVTRAVPDTARYGSVRTDDTGRITDFEEKQPGAGHINGGIYLLRHTVLESFSKKRPVRMEREVFPNMLKKKTGQRAHPEEAAYND